MHSRERLSAKSWLTIRYESSDFHNLQIGYPCQIGRDGDQGRGQSCMVGKCRLPSKQDERSRIHARPWWPNRWLESPCNQDF